MQSNAKASGNARWASAGTQLVHTSNKAVVVASVANCAPENARHPPNPEAEKPQAVGAVASCCHENQMCRAVPHPHQPTCAMLAISDQRSASTNGTGMQ